MAEQQYRVVVDGIGDRTGTVETPPMDREAAMAGFGTVLDGMRDDVAAGEVRVSVLSEDTWQQRSRR